MRTVFFVLLAVIFSRLSAGDKAAIIIIWYYVLGLHWFSTDLKIDDLEWPYFT